MQTDSTLQAGRKEWIGLAVLALACVVYAMDLTVLNLAVPELSADLKPTSSQLLWIVDIYGFMVAGSLLTMGTLGDRIGRRKLLMIGAVAFGVTSLLAAFSTSAGMLIVSRALLGLAGATLAPSTLSLIRNMFLDPRQRTVAIGIWITSFSAGAAVGPLLGGVLLEFFWWGSVFLLAVPVMALLLVLGPRLLPEFRDPEAGRLDLISAALSLVAILAVIFGLKELAQDGFGVQPFVAILAGLAVGVLFVRRQQTLADPLIDVQLFRIPAFSASLATNLLVGFAAFGTFLFIGQYLQLVEGLSPLMAGLWSLPSSVGFIVGSMLAPVFVRRVRPAYVMAASLVVASIGFGVLSQVDATSGLTLLVTGSIIFSLGLAPVFTLTTDTVMSSAPPERAGAASGISETNAELGGALGIAILGSIGAAIYRNEVADTLPAGVSPEAAESARDTLGGAVAVANELPDPIGVVLLESAREAFVQGLQLTTSIGAVVMVGTAILVAFLLRGARPGSGAEGEPETEHAVQGPVATAQPVLHGLPPTEPAWDRQAG
ncbi:MAG: MFS transporter [Thermomicrobiales bacterium]